MTYFRITSGALALAVVFGITSFFFTNCGQQKSLVSDAEKQQFLNENTVFTAAVSDGGSGFLWQDGDQIEDGATNNLPVGNLDGGSNPVLGDKRDQDDPANIGITIPEPGSPGGEIGGFMRVPGNGRLVQICTLESGKSGFQFLRSNVDSYTECQDCVVVDRQNGRCLRLARLTPPAVQVGNGRALDLADLAGDQGGNTRRPNRNNPSFLNLNEAIEFMFDDSDGGGVDPLVIDMIGDKRGEQGLAGLNLTPPQNGILFDLLGQRAKPQPHAKVQVSWTDNPTYMYLVLPDSRGQVRGIDQMFGDSTLGPDGRYSVDGFHALSKYDGRDATGKEPVSAPDNIIDKNDGVFARLRVWADTNFDGSASSDEMKSMEQAGIKGIDLKYDPNFYERDKYGNQAIFKSVVLFEDGHKGMVFDLWFKPFPNEVTEELRAPASNN